MKTVPVKHADRPALVDDEDYEKVARYRWRLMRHHGRRAGSVYATTDVRCGAKVIKLLMHRVLMDAPAEVEFDHINRDGLDNRKMNLRPATTQQNQMNRPKPAHGRTSKYKGVSWNAARGRWVAQIGRDKGAWLGRFDTELEAAVAYDAAARQRFAEFAVLNFPSRA